MPEKDASTGAEPTQQEPASTGADDSEIKVELAPEQQEPASTGDDPGQQERDAAKAAAEADAAKADETKTAEETKAAAEAEETAKAEEAAAQGGRDRTALNRRLQRERDDARREVRQIHTQRLQQMSEAERRHWMGKRDSSDPAERDEYIQWQKGQDDKRQTREEVMGEAENRIPREQFAEAMRQPFFQDSGLTPDEIDKALDARMREAQPGENVTYGSLISAAASAVVAKKAAELTEAQGQVKELETKVESLSAQLTDAGIVNSGSPPRSPNGDAGPGGLDAAAYAKKLAAGDEVDSDEVDKMTAGYLE